MAWKEPVFVAKVESIKKNCSAGHKVGATFQINTHETGMPRPLQPRHIHHQEEKVALRRSNSVAIQEPFSCKHHPKADRKQPQNQKTPKKQA
jgi:hypothetical protein